MKSHQKNRFSQVPSVKIPRSSFDRTSGFKTSLNGGKLIPIYHDEVLPGDTFNMKMTAFARLATPIKPIFDNMYMETFWFFVPNRLIWDNWQKFMGEQENPGDSTDYLIPIINSDAAGYAIHSIYDYFGLPTNVTASYPHSALPLRGASLIWNEWFRDENLQNQIPVHKDDGPDPHADYALQSRGKRHDYFTSCLPWPQKDNGNPVTLPLGERADVKGISMLNQNYSSGPGAGYETGGSGIVNYDDYKDNTSAFKFEEDPNNAGYPNIYADLSTATAATINQLRQAFAIQRLLERDARGGTRYISLIRSHFGVVSPDARLQRSEILGTGSSPVNISPIAQTTPLDGTPQGNLAAMGTVLLKKHGFTKSFTEHGQVYGFLSVRADLTYQRGLQRHWSRQTKYDFFWPALSHLGEMAVLSKEIYLDGTGADENVLGYQESFADYRYKPSQITGLFRSTAAGTLDIWHLSQDFQTRPVLGATFITDNPPIDRVIAVTNEPHFLLDTIMQLRCARPMPLYGVPGLIDHF